MKIHDGDRECASIRVMAHLAKLRTLKVISIREISEEIWQVSSWRTYADELIRPRQKLRLFTSLIKKWWWFRRNVSFLRDQHFFRVPRAAPSPRTLKTWNNCEKSIITDAHKQPLCIYTLSMCIYIMKDLPETNGRSLPFNIMKMVSLANFI